MMAITTSSSIRVKPCRAIEGTGFFKFLISDLSLRALRCCLTPHRVKAHGDLVGLLVSWSTTKRRPR